MKKDINPSAAVSKRNNSSAQPIGEPRNSLPQADRKLQASPAPISSRYIDSRLKQFCLR